MRDEKRFEDFVSVLLPEDHLSLVCLFAESLLGDFSFRVGDELSLVVVLLVETDTDSDVTPPDARRSLVVVVVERVVAPPSVFLLVTVLDHRPEPSLSLAASASAPFRGAWVE